MRTLLFFLILSLFCFFQKAAFAGQDIQIRVTEFPPNYYKNNSENWTGLGVELSSAIVKAAGFVPAFADQPWGRALVSMKKGSIQYITNIKKTDERSQFINWIGPIRQGEVRLIVKKGNENLPIKSLNDFVIISRNKNTRFGYLFGFDYTEKFRRRFENDPKFRNSFELTHRGEQNFAKLIHGRILGFFESTISANYRIKTDPYYKELAIHPFVLRRTPVYHGVSKKGVDAETLKKLRSAADLLQENGELQRIISKYQY